VASVCVESSSRLINSQSTAMRSRASLFAPTAVPTWHIIESLVHLYIEKEDGSEKHVDTYYIYTVEIDSREMLTDFSPHWIETMAAIDRE
jgi:hypothetical protein